VKVATDGANFLRSVNRSRSADKSHIPSFGGSIMFRIAFIAIALCGFFIDSAFAQKVVVKKKPAPQVGKDQFVEYDEWVVSFSRNNGPTVFELDSFHKTEADARKRADQLIQWSNTIQASGSKLAIIEIKGEPSVRNRNGTKKDGSLNLPDLKLNPNRKLGDVFREYSKLLSTRFESAKKAKDEAIARTTSLTQKEFDAVNKLVDDYNKRREAVRGETGYYFSQFQRLAPVTRSDLKAPVISDVRRANSPVVSDIAKPANTGDQRLAYIVWYGNRVLGFYRVPELTRERAIAQAIAEANEAKQLSPGQRIRVTEHRVPSSVSMFNVDAISKTPGNTILER